MSEIKVCDWRCVVMSVCLGAAIASIGWLLVLP